MSNDTGGWQDQIVGDRMAVDQTFYEHVQASSLSTQSWGLVMTAAEFEIVNADDPDEAELVANLDQLDSVISAIDEIEASGGLEMGAPAAKPGVFERLTSLFRSGSGNEEYREDAERLANQYATQLQERLVEVGKWEGIVETAAAEREG